MDLSPHTINPFVRALGCRATLTYSAIMDIPSEDPNRQKFAALSLIASPVNESAAQMLVY